nr:DNA polymerase IV [Gemmatimonadota bacterium]
LVADVGRTLRKLGLRTRTVSVKLRDSEFQDRQKNRTLPQAIQTDRVIGQVARELLHQVRKLRPGPIRLLGITLSSLEGPGSVEQLTFREIIPPLESDEER